jgi:hypothetical protein
LAGCGAGGRIRSEPYPFEIPDGSWEDGITNDNGPPTALMPCQDITAQTIYWGPTEEDVQRCSYSNTQEITVHLPYGEVITSSWGVQGTCQP